jgi:hypothetical protein
MVATVVPETTRSTPWVHSSCTPLDSRGIEAAMQEFTNSPTIIPIYADKHDMSFLEPFASYGGKISNEGVRYGYGLPDSRLGTKTNTPTLLA